jgi:serine/threonine protein kinase
MGAVYEATDHRFNRTVAIKQAFFSADALRRAFEREARLLNDLRHPALPVVIDYFAERDGWFLVMDYVPGDDLGSRLQRQGRPFAPEEVVRWADQVLDALEYLHGHEPPVIHRDIKPQNLKLTPRGDVKLLDFGLAKGTAAESQGHTTGTSVAGYTPHYAPIEQVQGAGTDPRSDLYALAATMYHLMTARIPPDALARAVALLNGEPDPIRPVRELNPSIPPEVAEVVHRALATSANQRPASAAAMRRALREAGGRHAPCAARGGRVLDGRDRCGRDRRPRARDRPEARRRRDRRRR